jgi:hypothetical protein
VFVPGRTPGTPWVACQEQVVQRDIHIESFRESLRETARTPKDLIAEADQLDGSYGNGSGFTHCAVAHLLDEFRGASHLTLHGSSSLYDPEKATGILDGLALLKTEHQSEVFRVFNRRHEQYRGYLGLRDDLRIMEQELLKPLWWRFSSSTRVAYLGDRKRSFVEVNSFETGQDLLLSNLMGLTYDIRHLRKRKYLYNETQ